MTTYLLRYRPGTPLHDRYGAFVFRTFTNETEGKNLLRTLTTGDQMELHPVEEGGVLMPLPWVRLDSNIGSHDKILNLLDDPSPKRWQAAFSYCAALGWSGGHGTDGRITASALPFVHGTPATARLLVTYRLWEEGVGCWHIVNYAEYQQLSTITESKKQAQSLGGKKARCRANHGPDCGCWSK